MSTENPLDEFVKDLTGFSIEVHLAFKQNLVKEERNRILNIIMNDDWSGESLEEDKKNLRYRITRHLIDEI